MVEDSGFFEDHFGPRMKQKAKAGTQVLRGFGLP